MWPTICTLLVLETVGVDDLPGQRLLWKDLKTSESSSTLVGFCFFPPCLSFSQMCPKFLYFSLTFFCYISSLCYTTNNSHFNVLKASMMHECTVCMLSINSLNLHHLPQTGQACFYTNAKRKDMNSSPKTAHAPIQMSSVKSNNFISIGHVAPFI